jgi:hypothetical protein
MKFLLPIIIVGGIFALLFLLERPVGPPNEINPSFNQKWNASAKEGCAMRVFSGFAASVSGVFTSVAGMRRAR